MGDPLAEAAKRSMQEQQAQQEFVTTIMNSFPGVGPDQIVQGIITIPTPEGVVRLIKWVVITPMGPLVLLFNPDFLNGVVDTAKLKIMEAKSGIEVVSNGNSRPSEGGK